MTDRVVPLIAGTRPLDFAQAWEVMCDPGASPDECERAAQWVARRAPAFAARQLERALPCPCCGGPNAPREDCSAHAADLTAEFGRLPCAGCLDRIRRCDECGSLHADADALCGNCRYFADLDQ